MKFLKLVAALFCLAQSQVASAQAVAAGDEQRFGEEMLRQFAEADASLRLVITEPLVISVQQSDGRQGAVYLQRIFQFCLQASVADCESSKAVFVRNIMAMPAPPSRTTLRVIVRDTGYADNARAVYGRRSPAASPLTRRIGDDLHAIVASDSPTQIEIITTLTLADLGLTEREAWDIALANTAAALPSLPLADQLRQQWTGYELTEYAASLLARPEQWQSLADAVGPDLFVTAVSDQTVMVGLLPPGAALERFRQAVREDCAAAERCVSPNLYRWRAGRWVIAPPP